MLRRERSDRQPLQKRVECAFVLRVLDKASNSLMLVPAVHAAVFGRAFGAAETNSLS
jgi:hypothetical protein